jgi:hypothetical protein
MYAPPDLKEDAKYWLRQPEAEYKDFAADLGPLIKDYLQQVHTDLIFTASSRLSHQLLVGRYKERCENYDWKNIADLIEEHVKKANQIAEEMGKSPRYEFEDLLTLHFARYLHDHGYSVHYTPRDGVHEPDLLGKLSNELEPIVVEAKVVGQIFGKQQGRDWIKNGLRALVAYLEKYHNDYGVIDGYIVVFRVGDETTPNFKFDQSEWTIGQFTINSTVINIGRINKKDPHIIIRREDFLQSYNSQNIG